MSTWVDVWFTDSVTLKSPTLAADSRGRMLRTFVGDGTDLKGKFEQASGLERTADQQTEITRAVLYLPSGTSVNDDDIVVYDSTSWEVTSVTEKGVGLFVGGYVKVELERTVR